MNILKYKISILPLIFFVPIFGAKNEQLPPKVPNVHTFSSTTAAQPPESVNDVINYIVEFDKYLNENKSKEFFYYRYSTELIPALGEFLNFLIEDPKKNKDITFLNDKNLLQQCYQKKYGSLILLGCHYLKKEDLLKNILINTRNIDINIFKQLKKQLVSLAQKGRNAPSSYEKNKTTVVQYAQILYKDEFAYYDVIRPNFQQIAFWCYNTDEEATQEEERKKDEAKKADQQHRYKTIKKSALIGITGAAFLRVLFPYFNKR